MQPVTERILITGGPGFGKSSIITELEHRGLFVFHEISRQIITRELAINGDCTPWQNVECFSEEVLHGRIAQYEMANGFCFYDRGLPDIAGFIVKEKKPVPADLWKLCKSMKYSQKVFFTAPWESIFHSDEERKEDFVAAVAVHKALQSVYKELGYTLINVPMGSICDRADFVMRESGLFY